jgi:hypothetical protein
VCAFCLISSCPKGEFYLGILINAQLPVVPQVGVLADAYFVPEIVLDRLLRSLASLSAIMGESETKFDFEKQLAKLTVRSKIPTVSWSRGLSWHVVDLREVRALRIRHASNTG